MGMFDTPTPQIDMSKPLHIRSKEQLLGSVDELADATAPWVKENLGYESPERKMKSIASKADLADGNSVQEAFTAIQAINPDIAIKWLNSIKPAIKQQMDRKKYEGIMAIQAKFPNPQTAEEFRQIGNALINIDPERAKIAYQQAENLKLTTTTSDKKGAHEKRLDTAAQLVPCVANFGGDWRNASPDCKLLVEKKAQSLKGTTPEQIGEGGYSKEALTAQAKRDEAIIDSSVNAVDAIIKTNYVLDLLGNGEVHTGFFANFKMNITRILAVAGSDKSSGYASRTQLLEALLGSDVFPMIKQLGIGARGLDTPEERKFLLKVMTGEITMEADAIRKLTKIRQKISKKIIERFNDKVDKGGFDRYTKYTGNKVNKINLKDFEKSKRPDGSTRGTLADGTVVWKYPDGSFHTPDGTPFDMGAN
jgi:hypothetical protein